MTAPVDSIVRLIQELVRQPSRAGVDSYDLIFSALSEWLSKHHVEHEKLADQNRNTVGLAGSVTGQLDGPAYLLNATVDTAPFGNAEKWSRAPTSAQIRDGWLFGRGSADSKAGVAIFCHVIAAVAEERAALHGALPFLFDADEHTGAFTGIKQYLKMVMPPGKIAGAMIGYPGNDRIVVGSRGFLRAIVQAQGKAAHAGSSAHTGSNAIEKAACLVMELRSVDFDSPPSEDFPLRPTITVTEIHGGEGSSTIPDLCAVHVDMRLTPAFDSVQAKSVLERIVQKLDERYPAGGKTAVRWLPGWPAYRLPKNSRVAVALQEAATRVSGRRPPLEIVGPSSIGNYLASLGIEATSGYGVRYQNLHGIDEKIELSSIGPIYETYLEAIRELLSDRRSVASEH